MSWMKFFKKKKEVKQSHPRNIKPVYLSTFHDFKDEVIERFLKIETLVLFLLYGLGIVFVMSLVTIFLLIRH